MTSHSENNRILIADDDPSIIRVLTEVLSSFGELESVNSGRGAIALLKMKSFDLVLTDFEMAGGTGLDVLAFLESQKSRIPAIMVTAFGTKELIMETMRYHVFGIIEKPFTHQVVVNTVREALRFSNDEKKMLRLAKIGTAAGELVHEIVNPLTVLDLQISQLEENENQENGDDLSKSVEKIKKIIASTQASMRGEKMTFNEFKIQEPLLEAEKEFMIRAHEKNVKVTFSGDLTINLKGDPDKMRQIIVNLANNAIDAAANYPDKWVEINIQLLSKDLHLTVVDSGKGIFGEVRARLFQTLFSTKGKKGSGLGLGIIRKLAREHKGDVFYVENQPHTQFKVIIPTE
ncbi:MAG: response regulator [Bdellovibrionia bacterium]